MTTLGEIRSQALKDLGDPTGKRFLAADLNSYINEGEAEFCALTGIYRTSVGFAITAGQKQYTIEPTTKILRITRATSGDGSRLSLIDEERMDFFKKGWRATLAPQGVPTHLVTSRTDVRTIWLYPAANEAAITAMGTNSMTVYFAAKPTPVTVDGTSMTIPDQFCPALGAWARYRAYGRNSDTLSQSLSAAALSEFQRYVQEGAAYAQKIFGDNESIFSQKE